MKKNEAEHAVVETLLSNQPMPPSWAFERSRNLYLIHKSQLTRREYII